MGLFAGSEGPFKSSPSDPQLGGEERLLKPASGAFLLPPVVFPCKDPCFLPIDGMCSLLDMHSNSILEILVLHRPLVLCHMDFKCPPGFSDVEGEEERIRLEMIMQLPCRQNTSCGLAVMREN